MILYNGIVYICLQDKKYVYHNYVWEAFGKVLTVYSIIHNNNNNNNNFKASSRVFVILKYFVKLYTQILFSRELLVKV